MPDELKVDNNADEDYDDPFTMRMKEVGIDWNKLQDGAELMLDHER